MTASAYTIFETAIGPVAVAWTERGLAAVELPGAGRSERAGRIRRRFPAAAPGTPTADIQAAIDGIVALLAGEAVDFGGVPLDMPRVPDFHRRVYEVARAIPRGRTLTYGEVAARLGDPGAARGVGQALGANPCPIVVPCHRVLAADGKLGGFSAPGGTATKLKLLRIEGAEAAAQLELF